MKALKNSIFFLVLGLPFMLNAQQPDLPAEEVDVIKSFDARLADAERFRLDPELPPLDTSVRRQNYDLTTRSLEVAYLPPKIRPLAMPSNKESGELYDGYLRLGAGFPTSFLGEGYYNVSSIENFNLGLSAKHHSANNNKQVENQRFSKTAFGADGTYHFD